MIDLSEQFTLAIDAIEARHANWFANHPDYAVGVFGKPLSTFTILHYSNGRFELLLSRNIRVPDQIRLECHQALKEVFGYSFT